MVVVRSGIPAVGGPSATKGTDSDDCVGGLEPMRVSKLIRALERAGLVERAENPDDTRAVQLNVTARGIEVVTAARKKVIELEDRRLAPLGGRRSDQSVELRDTLLTLLRHAAATNTERDGEPAPR
jgi:DNA-binding MarR family transcriptional regulator